LVYDNIELFLRDLAAIFFGGGRRRVPELDEVKFEHVESCLGGIDLTW